MLVTLRVLSPTKGWSKWQPGYQVLSSHDGSLKSHELGTNRVLQVNQRDVRELPASKPYDEIDPAPGCTWGLSKLTPAELAKEISITNVKTNVGFRVINRLWYLNTRSHKIYADLYRS